MDVINTKKELVEKLENKQSETIGFVPTMGYLHDGHLSLVKEARKENDIVVMSIFVNPLQFGPNEDFERYPRNEEEDIRIAKSAGVDFLFIPSVKEMYPEEMAIEMSFTKGTDVLCGRSRPGHFDGVATILTKLFHLVRPQKTYFGLKDAQQFAIVNTLITQFNFQIDLIGLPTVREADGLAKSSRNVYLSKEERHEALHLYKSLELTKELVKAGEKDPAVIMDKVKTFLLKHTPHGRIDYVSMLHYPDLTEVSEINNQIVLAIALQFEKARLIDNIILTPNGSQIWRIS